MLSIDANVGEATHAEFFLGLRKGFRIHSHDVHLAKRHSGIVLGQPVEAWPEPLTTSSPGCGELKDRHLPGNEIVGL